MTAVNASRKSIREPEAMFGKMLLVTVAASSSMLDRARRELDDARIELRALRSEEQRATMLDDELLRSRYGRHLDALCELAEKEVDRTRYQPEFNATARLYRDRFFAALTEVFGPLPFIAEDLGLITPEVLALRDRWGFPGMRVLQFAFLNDWNEDPFKPHNFIPNCVVYTGTHDNDTTAGWFSSKKTQSEKESALQYMNGSDEDPVWGFIRLVLSSVAAVAALFVITFLPARVVRSGSAGKQRAATLLSTDYSSQGRTVEGRSRRGTC